MKADLLLDSIEGHEAFRAKAYQDSNGVWTIGYGHNVQVMTISPRQAEIWLAQDVIAAEEAAKKFPEYAYLDTDARQNAFIEMVFNMGPGKVAEFKNMLNAIKQRRWDYAADCALDSLWARQVGQRAITLATMLRTGQFPQS